MPRTWAPAMLGVRRGGSRSRPSARLRATALRIDCDGRVDVDDDALAEAARRRVAEPDHLDAVLADLADDAREILWVPRSRPTIEDRFASRIVRAQPSRPDAAQRASASRHRLELTALRTARRPIPIVRSIARMLASPAASQYVPSTAVRRVSFVGQPARQPKVSATRVLDGNDRELRRSRSICTSETPEWKPSGCVARARPAERPGGGVARAGDRRRRSRLDARDERKIGESLRRPSGERSRRRRATSERPVGEEDRPRVGAPRRRSRPGSASVRPTCASANPRVLQQRAVSASSSCDAPDAHARRETPPTRASVLGVRRRPCASTSISRSGEVGMDPDPADEPRARRLDDRGAAPRRQRRAPAGGHAPARASMASAPGRGAGSRFTDSRRLPAA